MPYILEVKEDKTSKDLFIELPEDFLKRAGWKTGDSINWKKNSDGTYTLTKVKVEKLEKKLAEIRSQFSASPHAYYVYCKYRPVEEVCLFISRWSYRLTTGLYLDIKYKLQDWFRGYNDLDKWNAAWYIARKAIPVLKAMREGIKGTSLVWHREDRFGNIIELTHDEVFKNKEEPDSFTEEEWKNILSDIIFVFEYTLDMDDANIEYSEDQEVNRRKRYKRGLRLFSIYYGNLWD